MSEITSEIKPDIKTANPKVDQIKKDWQKLAGIRIEKKKWFKPAKKYLLHKQAGRWFAGLVLAPWLLAAGYYAGVASDRFVSEASFMIEKSDGGVPSFDGFSLLGVGGQSAGDQKLLEAYINSPDMMLALDKQLNLRDHYSTADWLSGLSKDASFEDFLSYYRDHLKVRFNDSNGLLELEVQGFTPEFAKSMAQEILNNSEHFVNKIGHDLADEQLKFVQGEVGLAEHKLKGITAQLVAFQNTTGLLSAEQQGAALSSILNELQAELVKSQTELETKIAYLNTKSPQVVALKQRIAALESQIDKESQRLTDDENTSINDLAAQQKELQLELELATKAYSSSLIALETARTEASRKLKQLVVISSPHLSDDAKYPRVAYSLTNILLILLAVFGLIRMIRATVREHRD
ncbi:MULTISPECIES: hypothetical protein [unclassified Endozoicomonas]|uniref:hypothetical protein n=1 Tax=unclassified Endozoicomonas TaxID=2644528 RepID=UPI003BB69A5E